jgi:phage terminase small subunit
LILTGYSQGSAAVEDVLFNKIPSIHAAADKKKYESAQKEKYESAQREAELVATNEGLRAELEELRAQLGELRAQLEEPDDPLSLQASEDEARLRRLEAGDQVMKTILSRDYDVDSQGNCYLDNKRLRAKLQEMKLALYGAPTHAMPATLDQTAAEAYYRQYAASHGLPNASS